PFLEGRNTGLKSSRSMVFKRLPRTGIPEAFASYAEYQSYVDLLVNTGCIDAERRVWFDLRPHPIYSTLEFRICDLPTKVDEVIAIAALVQALVARLLRLHRDNQAWRGYRTALIEENKWRAVRYGVHGKLIDFGRQKEVPLYDLVMEMLEFVDGVVDILGSRDELAYVESILKNGTSADRQLQVFQETGSVEAVVDQILNETMLGV
ncbi:MAG TPA: carboxylate-amine ligase, partial [Myxococcales bacterium]|nr:carboxylate-amine ligase [Myxococcales bacterium]